MGYIKGIIISGEFDQVENIFTLQEVKNFPTETLLKKEQLQELSVYLQKNLDKDGQILSLYDQLLVRFSNDEIEAFLADIETIQTLYN